MDYTHQFLFGLYPYICIVVFFVGCVLRMDRDPYSWRAKSSQIMDKKSLQIGSNLLHVGMLLLFLGHFFGLLTPKEVYHALGMTAATKQLIAMVMGGIFGLICFAGITILLWRRLFNPRVRATSSAMDIIILLAIYAQLILGMISIGFSAQHPDGSGMVALATWAQHLVTFKGDAASYIIGVDWIFKVHIILGLTLFLLTPFTRLVHVLSAPIEYIFRGSLQIVRRRG